MQACWTHQWETEYGCFWTVVLEKTPESPLDCKEIQPTHPKGDQSWVFIGRTDVEAEAPILWPPHAKSWLIGKDPVAGKDWGQEEKGTTKDEMVGWCHQLNEHGFGWTLGAGDGRGGLACCGSWGRKELDTTEWLKWTECLYAAFYIYNFHRGTFFNFTDFSNMQINKEIKTFSRKSQSFPRENSIVLNQQFKNQCMIPYAILIFRILSQTITPLLRK